MNLLDEPRGALEHDGKTTPQRQQSIRKPLCKYAICLQHLQNIPAQQQL